MSLEYLESLEAAIDGGDPVYACPGAAQNTWHISRDIDELRKIAQRLASNSRYEGKIYRLVNKMATTQEDFYLAVRKILEPSAKGEPHLHWTLVGTREAAEMVRDVSVGPTPFFGASVEEVIERK